MDITEASEYHQLSPEQLLLKAKDWTADQWKSLIDKMAIEQIAVIIPLATENHDPAHWRQKTRAVIEGLSNPKKIEEVGRVCSAHQIQEIISLSATIKDSLKEKLFPLFIGMPHEVFLRLLIDATPKQLSILKQESLTEPVQHHLTLLTHDLSSRMAQANSSATAFELAVQNLNLVDIDLRQINIEHDKIITLLTSCNSINFISSKALSLAWNTNRTDLIEKLSKIKEQSQRLILQVIGKERSASSAPSGLFLLLEKRLDSVFSSPNDIEALNDEEPATEALVKFSVWYLQDYFDIGLLPDIQHIDQLELDPQNYSEKERSNHREILFQTAEQHLEQLGLFTLSDLKQAKIYSKKALKDFILANQSKLAPIQQG